MLQLFRSSMLLPVLLILTGCFGGSSEKKFNLEPVSGTLKINGDLGSNAELSFLPMTGTSGTGAYAVTDEKGMFTLNHRSGEKGIEAGKYKVIFSKFVKPDGSPVLPEEDAATVGVELLPVIYTNFERARVVAEVPVGGKEFQFDLKFKTK